MKKKKRQGLTPKDIFTNPKKAKYLHLFVLIKDYSYPKIKKIKFRHIRYALCINHGLNLSNPIKEKNIRNFFYNSSPPYTSDKFKFNTYQRANNACQELIKLKLVKLKPDKFNDYYVVTRQGYCLWQRCFIHMWIDEYCPDDPEKLKQLSNSIVNLWKISK